MSPEAIKSVTQGALLVSQQHLFKFSSFGIVYFDTENGLFLTPIDEDVACADVSPLQPGGRFLPPFLPARVDPSLVAGQLEAELRALAAQHREVS